MVWSDQEIIRLSAQFVTVADEVYMLYPEDPGNLSRVKDDPAHLFFKKYGESMPPGDWNHPGTKQGIYMMGPNGEYLEGKFAAASNPADIQARLRRAIQRWDALRQSKGYANSPIPSVKATYPPDVSGELIFRVNSRDLPRGAGDRSGRRITEAERTSNAFMDFTKWAWNETWVGVAKTQSFVPDSSGAGAVPISVARSIARTALLDNVRGQNPEWRDQDIKNIAIRMNLVRNSNGSQVIEYTGSAQITDGNKSYSATCYGEGVYDSKVGKFSRLDLVWLGMRGGAAQFNQRANDRGPAPMGVTLSLFKE